VPKNNKRRVEAAPSPAHEGAAVLLTAFEPFGGSAVNASLEAARRLDERDPRIELLIIPVVRGAAERTLLDRLEQEPRPSLVISLGEADRRPYVRLEKVAINWDNYRIADNAGNQPRDEMILPGGPAAHFATLPVSRIAEALTGRTPLPVIVSLSAGSFLCNRLAYVTAEYLQHDPVCPFGFVHVPAWRPDDGDGPLADLVDTLRALVDLAPAETSPAPQP